MENEQSNEQEAKLTQQEHTVLNNLKEEGIEISTNDVSEVLESLPEDKRRVIVGALYAVEASSSFRGPLPPPEILKEYESILPGASERILKMAEKQQDHRISIEKTIVDRQTKQSGHGQTWGGILTILLCFITVFLGYYGHDVLAGFIGTTTIIGLATIFVLHKAPPKPNKEKDEVNEEETTSD